MRVVLVVPVFPQISETFIVSKAVGLLDRGWDVHVICGASADEQWDAFGPEHRVQDLRGRVHVSPPLTPRWSSAMAASRQVARLRKAPHGALRRYLSDSTAPISRRLRDLVLDADLLALAPDVVHFEFGSLAPERMGLGRRLGAAVTVSFRGYDLNYVGLDQPGYYQEVWDHADGIHVLGADLWRRAVQRGAPADLPHTRISPALDTTAIMPTPVRPGPLGGADDPLRVLSVGRLHWKKGYDYALEAVAALRDQGLAVEYRIVGDGGLLEAAAFWRHQLGLDEQVQLLRSVPPAEVARQLAWADVFLHAATSEGFCNAVIEAQAHGVPVVCSDADGLPENVAHDVTGLVVPRRDPKAMAEGLTALAADATMRARMGTAGPERVKHHFQLRNQLDAWERFYEDAVARRARV